MKSGRHRSAKKLVQVEVQKPSLEKPAIISSRGTSLQMQLNQRPSPVQDKQVSISRASARSTKTEKSQARSVRYVMVSLFMNKLYILSVVFTLYYLLQIRYIFLLVTSIRGIIV